MKKVTYLLLFIIVIFVVNSNLALSADDASFKFDGKIVFTIGQEKKNIDHIYLLNGTRRKLTRLTEKGRNFWPKWSPDGKKIVFVSVRDEHKKNYEIYLMDTDGQNQKRITETPDGNATKPRWDSTGEKIFYRCTVMGDTKEKVLSLKTAEVHVVPNTGNFREIKSKGNANDYIKELSKKSDKEMKEGLEKELEKAADDMVKARRIIFERYPSPDSRYYALYYSLPGRIVLLDVQTQELKELKSQRSGTPAWSKDGKKLAYVNGENGDHFTIFDIDKNQYTEIRINKKEDEGCGGVLSWSRDSKKFVYACGTDYIADSSKMYILDLETQQAKVITNGESPDWH